MDPETGLARRLACLPTTIVDGCEVRVASTPVSRLLGLALLRGESAGTGLLIPRCRSIHTFGMRFDLEVVFLDREGQPIRRISGVGASRFLSDRRADSILELVRSSARPRGERPESLPTQRAQWFLNEKR